MHEISICQSLVGLIADEASRSEFTRVTRVRLEIGRFAGIEPQALLFGFDVTARGTVAEGAALDIIDLPGRAWCFDCNASIEIDHQASQCPRCDGGRLRVTGGDELRIKDLEVI